jgi:hypothetical protein
MCSPKSLISICTSLVLSMSIGLIIATSLFSFLFSPLASSATSRSGSWTPYSTLVDKSLPSEDPWADVTYFNFFLSCSCKMGGKVTKPKTITVTETSGLKEEDHSCMCCKYCTFTVCSNLCHCVIVYVIPGQTFALVLVTASTRISFFFLSHSAALPLFHPKNVKAGTQRKDFF